MVNLDDLNLELLPAYIEGLLRSGAKNAYFVNGITKKGRLGVLLLVDLEDERKEEVINFILSEIGTIGIRILKDEHISFTYLTDVILVEINEAKFRVRVKKREKGGTWVKAEFDDLKRVWEMEGIPIAALKSLVEAFVLMEKSELSVNLCGKSVRLKREGSSF